MPQTVECAGFDKRFHGLLVETISRNTHREIVERFKGPVGLAFGNNAFTNGLTDSFDCRQAKVDNSLFNLWCEINIGNIDIWWSNRNTARTRID